MSVKQFVFRKLKNIYIIKPIAVVQLLPAYEQFWKRGSSWTLAVCPDLTIQ